MKKIIFTCFALCLAFLAKAQNTAMDFTKIDCNGNSHHHFAELDSGQVSILEFFMTCSSCSSAAKAIEKMLPALEAKYPGKVKWYMMAYTNSYSCATASNFIKSNNLHAVSFDSGASLVAYYGGFGMPTIAVVAGPEHKVLFTSVGFTNSDTVQMGASIKDYLSASAVAPAPAAITGMKLSPNPATSYINVQFDLALGGNLSLELVDITGKTVSTVYNGYVSAGAFQTTINTQSVAKGMYLLKARIDGETSFQRVNIIR